jgi:hypothetical protein
MEFPEPRNLCRTTTNHAPRNLIRRRRNLHMDIAVVAVRTDFQDKRGANMAMADALPKEDGYFNAEDAESRKRPETEAI